MKTVQFVEKLIVAWYLKLIVMAFSVIPWFVLIVILYIWNKTSTQYDAFYILCIRAILVDQNIINFPVKIVLIVLYCT